MSDSESQPISNSNMSRMERKAKATDEAFRTIVQSEAAQREKKTARLRALRLQKEAAEGSQKTATTRRKK